MSEKMIPNVRFRGFADAWEQRKLGSLGTVAMNKRIYKNQTSDTGEIPFYKIGTFGGQPDSYISRKLFNEYKSKYPFPEKGDLLISAAGSIGRIVEYTGKDEYYQDSNIVWLKHDKSVLNIFLKPFYSVVKWQGLEGSTIKRLYNKNILNTYITLPSTDEQNVIGVLFETLDNTIVHHQRKLDNLKKLKKLFLQKLFDQEWRFKGFTDAWEQRRLTNYLTESFVQGTTGATANKLTVKLWGKGVIPKREIYSGSSKTKYYKRSRGQFIYGKLDFLHEAFGIIPNELDGYESTIDSPAFDISNKVNGVFLLESISRKEFYLRQGILANGSRKAKRIHEATFLNMRINMPVHSEQNQIAAVLEVLDNTVAHHQRKLDQLKQLKKWMLQNLFI